jgi:O-succinylbenzoic acid--CoA ligase
MDASLLSGAGFWSDVTPALAGIPELAGHVLFETSGSTGVPKWVAISKQALLISAAAVNRHLGVASQSAWGLALPLNHVGGFGVAARAYEAGCDLHIFKPRWAAGIFRDWLEMSKVSHTSLVPTQVHDLVNANLCAPAGLMAIVVGGGHLDAATGQAARDLGWPVLASYGMSEAASQIATQGLEQLELAYQSAPLPLLPIWEAEVSAAGCLAISGPALFSGTVSGGQFSPRTTDWHSCSDRALLENRQLTPLGRVDSLVKILGELVDPEAIERELLGLSAGLLAPAAFAVIAMPDARSGHVLLPLFEASVNPALIQRVLSLYAQQAPGFRRLRPPAIVEKLPRSELGKLRRMELCSMWRGALPLPRAGR